MSVWRNDIKCKYMFMFPLKDLSRKGLIVNKSSIWNPHICHQATHNTALLQATILVSGSDYLNSLAPGRFQSDFENVIFNLALLIGIFKTSYDNVLRWKPQNITDDKSTLVQVMAWCRQATSHYLNQYWPRSPMPYGVTRPQWVN